MKSHVLIIEDNFAERTRILKRFKEYKLRHQIQFVSNYLEALAEVYFYNKSHLLDIAPIILFNYSRENIHFIEKLKSDRRYKEVKLYIMIEDNLSFYRQKLQPYKIQGIVNKALDFRNQADDTYLDITELYLQLLRMAINRKAMSINRSEHES